jgi:hypothetical protein
MPGVYFHKGAISVEDFSKLADVLGPNAVTNSDAARMAGFDIALGDAKDLDIIKRRLAPGAVSAQYADLSVQAKEVLTTEAIHWLAIGERGLSSDFIFESVTGVQTLSGSWAGLAHHPRDLADFRRCQLLLEFCPEIAAKFESTMSSKSPAWSFLVGCWRGIVVTLDEDSPGWRVQFSGSLDRSRDLLSTAIKHGESQRFAAKAAAKGGV